MADVCIIEIDRWGRFLLAEGDDARWRLPAGPIARGESPDLAAVRVFEELTGEVLDELFLYRSYRAGEAPWAEAPLHVYYFDADLDQSILGEGGRRFARVEPRELDYEDIDERDQGLLKEFAGGTHYKAMFH